MQTFCGEMGGALVIAAVTLPVNDLAPGRRCPQYWW